MRPPTPTEWQAIQQAFDRLVDQPLDSQEQALTTADFDPFVAGRVRAMLAAHRDTGVLDQLAPRSLEDPMPEPYSSLKAGDIVGAFRIERLIGRGGTGEVYLAQRSDADFAQAVALKLLRPEAAHRNALFDAERQMLAWLEHPGIARLIDGGRAPDGRAFMALEYVDGETITASANSHDASLAERLRLFLEVCDAVAYAHAHLVIHRDIKPANILVDAQGRVRLLDFGVAKLLETAGDATHTQAMLTPDYAAPEQFRRERPTVATDVYALGGVLFELLTGQGPWRSDNALPSSVMRLMDQEPEAPSRFAERHPASPVPSQRIAGDLDAIVLKAMRHAPTDRYNSVAALADDVRRHLSLEPVQARGGNTVYAVGRFIRRHRWATAATAAGLIALIAGAGGVAWQARQTAIERDIARAEAGKAEAVNSALTLMFRNAKDFGAGGSATAQDLLNGSSDRLLASFDKSSPDTADVVYALSDLYVTIGDVVGAEALLNKALKAGVGANDPVGLARLQMRLGDVKTTLSQFDEAKRLLDQSDQMWQTDPARFRKERLEAIAARAQMLRLQGSRDEAIRMLSDSLPQAEAEYASQPRDLLVRYQNLAVHLVEANRLDELEALLNKADAFATQSKQTRTPVALSLMQIRGGLYSRRNDHVRALEVMKTVAGLRRDLYGPSLGLANDLTQQGMLMLGLSQVKEAVPVLEEGHRLAQQFGGANSQILVMNGISLGSAYAYVGDIAKARATFAAIEASAAQTGRDALLYGVFLRGRIELWQAQKQFARAQADLDAAAAIFRKVGPAGEVFLQSLEGSQKRLNAAKAS